MGLDLPDGGHLTHGYASPQRKVSATSLFFESLPYKIDPKTGRIDYEKLRQMSLLFRPKIIVAGSSSYSRLFDYKELREIATNCGAYLMADIAHVAGLVAAQLIPSPFPYCDVVTTTTHKTLRGPRAGLIFYKQQHATAINNAVFPGLQGGPHNNVIAGIATTMRFAASAPFLYYQKQLMANAAKLAECLCKLGLSVISGGTDIHMFILDLSHVNTTAEIAEYVLAQVGITCNKNMIPSDKRALHPSGLRFGTPYITSLGATEADMEMVATFIHSGICIATKVYAQLQLHDAVGTKQTYITLLELPDNKLLVGAVKQQVVEFAEHYVLDGQTYNVLH